MTKEYKKIILIFIILLVFGLLVVFVLEPKCLFKELLGIPCPGCGLTRGFREIFKGEIIQALKYNILSVPIFIFLLISLILFIIDIIKKNNYLQKYLLIFKKHYILIIGIVIINWIINIIKYI